MNNSPVVVALTSYGMSGRVFHAPLLNYLPNFMLKTVLERSKNLSAEKYPEAQIVRSYDDILNDSEIELVIVNTPSYLHYDMTKAALKAGKHVVVEKPFTANIEEGEELMALANEKKMVLSVYHNKRFEGIFKTIEVLLEEKKLGDLRKFEMAWHRYRPEIGPKKWKENDMPAAGLLYDLGSHMIDQCLQLFGWPVDIEVDLQKQRKGSQVVDYFSIDLKYNGFVATLRADMLTKEKHPVYKITGTEGIFIKNGLDPQEGQLNKTPIHWEHLGVAGDMHAELIMHASNEQQCLMLEERTYLDYYRNVYEVIRNGAQLIVKPDEGLDVVRMIQWVQEKNNDK